MTGPMVPDAAPAREAPVPVSSASGASGRGSSAPGAPSIGSSAVGPPAVGSTAASSTAAASTAAGPSVQAGPSVAERRFGGVARLYGAAGAARIAGAHVVVIGLGGVGSWAAEALARCGVGRLTLIDMDHVAESNVNRQVHALDSTLGASKIAAMAARIAGISPATVVTAIDDFVTVANVAAVVDPLADAVIDAIDAPRAKAAVIALCAERAQPVVVCGAAGARSDPLALRRGDLGEARGDALLASVRARLRRDHGFARGVERPFGVRAIWSPAPAGARATLDATGGAPLACAGYGSVVMVTAAMGFAAAADAVAALHAAPALRLPRPASRAAHGPPGHAPTAEPSR
jgi:tRNA A37 threonylcarbamoyladenosine dehydratase